jgi:hypothetical protein
VRAVRTAAVQGAIDELDGADRALIEHALPALERLAQTLAEGSPARDQAPAESAPARAQALAGSSPNADEPR